MLPFTQFHHFMEILLRRLRFRSRKWKDAYVFIYAEVRGWTIPVKYSEGFHAKRGCFVMIITAALPNARSARRPQATLVRTAVKNIVSIPNCMRKYSNTVIHTQYREIDKQDVHSSLAYRGHSVGLVAAHAACSGLCNN